MYATQYKTYPSVKCCYCGFNLLADTCYPSLFPSFITEIICSDFFRSLLCRGWCYSVDDRRLEWACPSCVERQKGERSTARAVRANLAGNS
jgi:hypothetical protein